MKLSTASLFIALSALAVASDAPRSPANAQPPISPLLSVGEGELQATERSVRAWRPNAWTELAGRYRLIGITDGHGWLDVKIHKDPQDKTSWRVETTIVTEWTKDEWTTMRVENAPLETDNELPYFEAGRKHFAGFFVEFTYFDRAHNGDKAFAVVVGRDVFVRDDGYSPRSYREPDDAK